VTHRAEEGAQGAGRRCGMKEDGVQDPLQFPEPNDEVRNDAISVMISAVHFRSAVSEASTRHRVLRRRKMTYSCLRRCHSTSSCPQQM